MPKLTDFAEPKKKLSFKKGTLAFRKRRKVAEAIAAKNPAMPMDKKFKIATAAVKEEDK